MLTPTGYPPANTAAGTAHSTPSTQPALPPHRATPRVEDNTPVDAPAPLKRYMLAPFGGPRPRVSAKGSGSTSEMHHASRCHMERDGTRDLDSGPTQGTHTGDPHSGPSQGTHTEGTHTREPHRGTTQGTHTEGRAPQRTHHRRGGPHRGPTQRGPTQGTYTGEPHRGPTQRGGPHRGPTTGGEGHIGDPHRTHTGTMDRSLQLAALHVEYAGGESKLRYSIYIWLF